MHYLFKLIAHFLTSNSRHGTHSPFVYKLADEVIYKKNQHGTGSKKQALLVDIANYLSVSYAECSTDIGLDKAWLIQDNTSLEKIAVLQHQFKYLVLKDIYKSKYATHLWKDVCKDPRFIVCVDLFYYGFIFYRKEQPKELFRLRFPYWG